MREYSKKGTKRRVQVRKNTAKVAPKRRVRLQALADKECLHLLYNVIWEWVISFFFLGRGDIPKYRI